MPSGYRIHENPIDDLKAYYEKTGGNFGYKEYRKGGGKYSRKVFYNRFGSWNQALRIAGIEPLVNKFKTRITPPDISIPSFIDIPKINAPRVIATADWHIPFHNIGLIEEMLDFNGKKFKRIHWTPGNHDHTRLVRLFQDGGEARNLKHLIFNNPAIKLYNHFFMEVNDWIRFNHPDQERKTLLSLALELCDTYCMSVINFHSHRFAYGKHKSSKYLAGDGLHFTCPESQEYKMLKMNPYHQWIAGWWCVEDKSVWPYVRDEQITNLGQYRKPFLADDLLIVGDFLDLKKLYKKDVQESISFSWTQEMEIAVKLVKELVEG